MKKLLFIFLLALHNPVSAQVTVNRIEPPFWWTGMSDNYLQLLVYGQNIGRSAVIINHPAIKIKENHWVENQNYLFIDLEISEAAKPCIFPIVFEYQREIVATVNYELKARAPGSSERIGFSPADVIYLIMPDRFANSDSTNDNITGMLEIANPAGPNGRHGGDLRGISEKLDYLDNLGITGIWLNPVLENNMPKYSYHGYAITDYYKVDPRFGSNEDYKVLIDKCHEKGLKMIMDMVFNHCGSYHWWMSDLPMADWIHQFPEFTRSNYRSESIMDPYASQYDLDLMQSGWFDKTMPDLNQHNEFLANYLIQNSIWWIEYAGLDGIRMDTYPYSYPDFMASWMKRINTEYPQFNVLGETWLQKETQTAYWQSASPVNRGQESNLKYVTDFPLYFAIDAAFTEPEGWTTGLSRLYYVLSQDFLYSDPEHTVIFADNHDLSRFFSSIGEDLNKWKMAMAFILTTRGMPVIYYGTEILMTGLAENGHGFIRQDFPWKWEENKDEEINETNASMRKEAYAYVSKLLNWRRNNDAVYSGKLKHFVPQGGIYVYFRYTDQESVMVILNKNNSNKELQLGRFLECLEGFNSAKDIISGGQLQLGDKLILESQSAMILELHR